MKDGMSFEVILINPIREEEKIINQSILLK